MDCNRKTVSTPLHAVVLPLLIVVAVEVVVRNRLYLLMVELHITIMPELDGGRTEWYPQELLWGDLLMS